MDAKLLFIVLFSTLFSGCLMIRREHREAASITIENINSDKVDDGIYEGSYLGGMYGWRENKVRIKVQAGRFTDITLLYSKELTDSSPVFTHIVKKVIELKSLNIDALSGATLTTKAHLKAMENALLSSHVTNGE